MEFHNISVIVQGTVDENITSKCLKSVRKYLPDAEIVLASYIDTNTNDLDFDKLALVEDPGFYPYNKQANAKPNNINRQIQTTLAGLKAAARKYAFKLRSDFIINGCGFIDFFNQFPKSDPEYKIFEEKLLSCTCFARNPRDDKNNFAHHPSDIAFFGLRSDLLNLFNLPLMSKEDFEYMERKGYNLSRFVPEQYLWISCLRKNGKIINCDNYLHINKLLVEETEHYFVSNFIFLDYEQFNLVPPKRLTLFSENDFNSIITHIEWQRLYKQYIDNTHQAPEKNELRDSITAKYKKLKKLKNIRIYTFIVRIITIPIRIRSIRHKLREKLIRYMTKDIHI